MDELTLTDRITLRHPADLPFSDCMHRLVTLDRSARSIRRTESEAGRDPLLDESMILRDDVVLCKAMFDNDNAGQSLMGLEALVASPIFDEQEAVIGIVYGSRDMRTADENKQGIEPLEAQFVQLLAGAVSAGLARMSREARESVILLSAQGRRFQQSLAGELARLERIVLVCGRYEGVDERVAEHLADREISVGDYILSGGELAAAIIVDAVARLVPGALGNEASARQESFTGNESGQAALYSCTPSSTCGSGGLLDYPHYTRPAEFRGMSVPEVLVSGDHEQIRRWRRRSALEKTVRNRPDLLAGNELSEEDRDLIARITGKSI